MRSENAAQNPASRSPGYRICSLRASEGQSGAQRLDEPYAVPDHITLLDGDDYLATAQRERIRLYRYIDLNDDRRSIAPLAQFAAAASVQLMGPGLGPFGLVVALADNTLWNVNFPDPAASGFTRTVRAVKLADDLDGDVHHLICTRRVLLVVTDGGNAGPMIVEVDRQAGRVTRRARLPLANVITVRPLAAIWSELLLVVDDRHGAMVAGFPSDQDGSTLRLTPFDPDARITAATAVDDRWLVVARKGGELVKTPLTPYLGGRPGLATETYRQARDGGVLDDEPCELFQRAQLNWSVAKLDRVGNYLLAISVAGNRMAVLDANLNLVFERFLGPNGYLLATGAPWSDRMLAVRRGKARLEAWSLNEYCRSRRGPVELPIRNVLDRTRAKTATFWGHRSQSGAPNPHLKVVVFTVTEPGQSFADPNQSRMHVLLEPNVYAVARDYYTENSFQTLQVEFTVFGVHIGGSRRPLVLPRAIASYFWDDFVPGGVEAVMPGMWTNPLVLDGSETMTLHTDPAVGVGKDYPIPFAALWTSRIHNAYPVVVNFTGAETLQVDVLDRTGITRTLVLSFGPLSLNHAQGDDENAFLSALGQHITGAVRAAEAAAGLPAVLEDVSFRRIRDSTDDSAFGRLQGQFSVAGAGEATQKGRVTITSPGVLPDPLDALGLAGGQAGVLGSRAQIVTYLRECLHAARFDAGEGVGLNDPHLSVNVGAEEDTTAQTVRVRINLTAEKGGSGAQIAVLSSDGLTASGWSEATPVLGGESRSNNRNTVRYPEALGDDVFTAAMDHIRATRPWDAEAVRAQFANFDAMVISFVGACPTTVAPADQWHSTDPVDFDRLRGFRAVYQATDLHNPNPDEAPVTMRADVLIGLKSVDPDPAIVDKFHRAAAVLSHEIGHGLGLPDLYFATGFRDDVRYLDRWCQMAGANERFNHFCAWSKWVVGWIAEGPPDSPLNRVINVKMPEPTETTLTEAWLVPVEHWDNTIRADVIATVGSGIPIGQLMKVHLGSDGGVVDFIELRAPGRSYSKELPPTPAVIVTNVLDPHTDRRWVVNGLYRRNAHLLNDGSELTAIGDSWDFAAAAEFPLKGCKVHLVDQQTIRGGTIPICRLRVEREPAEFIDLHFQDNVPSWHSPDIWVDWPGNNPDPSVPQMYPEGTPTDQGEAVRFPGSGVEPHFVVARPHNAGNVRAEDVKVRWFICDPPGGGDNNRWVQRDTQTLAQLPADSWDIVPFTWAVDPTTNDHLCLRAEIIDWTIPAGVDPATGDTLALSSDDVLLQNNNAQKNVIDFEAAT